MLALSVGSSLAQIIEGGSRLLSHGGVHDDLRAACVSACSGANAQAARFRDKLLPIWERHGIRPIGFWTTLVGESSNELTYILQNVGLWHLADIAQLTRQVCFRPKSGPA
jgi:hypothetical protein